VGEEEEIENRRKKGRLERLRRRSRRKEWRSRVRQDVKDKRGED
jgi:hypothetical protein